MFHGGYLRIWGAQQSRQLPGQAQRGILILIQRKDTMREKKNKSPDTPVIPNGYNMSQVSVVRRMGMAYLN